MIWRCRSLSALVIVRHSPPGIILTYFTTAPPEVKTTPPRNKAPSRELAIYHILTFDPYQVLDIVLGLDIGCDLLYNPTKVIICSPLQNVATTNG
jgi:hypothetical protein